VLEFHKTGSGSVAAGNLKHRYLWGPAVDQLLADEQVSSVSVEGEVLWALTDHLGSVRDVVDSSGQLRLHRDFDSFGNVVGEIHYNASGQEVTSGTGFVTVAFAFTGRLLDEETGLQNNLNRWYDPATGSWISEDPIGFLAGDANLNRYVGNEPTGYIDPLGLQSGDDGGNGYGGDSWLVNRQKVEQADPGFWQRLKDWFWGAPYKRELRNADHTQLGNLPRWNDRDTFDTAAETGALAGEVLRNTATDAALAGAGELAALKLLGKADDATRLAKAGRFAGSYDDAVIKARRLYPHLAGVDHYHHITPIYLGGARSGPRVRIDRAYHQVITNAFRQAWPYGQKMKPSPQELRRIMNEVYDAHPLPSGTTY
jgi:RHS repeat-associated protein